MNYDICVFFMFVILGCMPVLYLCCAIVNYITKNVVTGVLHCRANISEAKAKPKAP